MGIHGLTGFIDRNQYLLHDFELHDTDVVIDGNNFYHYVYYACHVRHMFGGDYDVYRKKIFSIFESFRACNIRPYLVFDGAYTKDGRKLQTSLLRAKDRIHLVSLIQHVDRGKVLPVLAFDTFLQALNELNVPHVTCEFEADGEIAVLANKLGCPVISCDSDFYIFDLTHGFLPLDYIDFRPLKRESSLKPLTFLSAQKYHIDKFIDSFDGLSRSVLPLFGSLLGNDVISAAAFENLYSRFEVPKLVSKKFSFPPRLKKVLSVIHWLRLNHDSGDIVEEVMSFINPDRRDAVRSQLQCSISGYTDMDNFTGPDLLEFFSQGNQSAVTPSKDFCSYVGRVFPPWFIRSVSAGEITPSLLNIAILRRVILLTQVEDLSLPSSYTCSEELRQIAYSILLKDDSDVACEVKADDSPIHTGKENETVVEYKGNHENESVKIASQSSSALDICKHPESLISNSHDSCEAEAVHASPSLGDNETSASAYQTETDTDSDIINKSSKKRWQNDVQVKPASCRVEEYRRVVKDLKKVFVEPVVSISDAAVPSVSDVPSMSVKERRSLLLLALRVSELSMQKLDPSLQLFVASVIMWGQKADPKISVLHVDCVILCSLLLHAHFELASRTNCDQTAQIKREILASEAGTLLPMSVSLTETCHSCEPSALQKLCSNFEKYHKIPPSFSRNNQFDVSIVHAFAQLQACLLDASNLNKLLRFPLPNIQPSKLLNGTFLYNMFSDLKQRTKPDLFVASLTGERTVLAQLFQNLKSLILESVGADRILAPVICDNKKARKRKSKEAKKGKAAQQKVKEVDREAISSTDGVESIVGFSIANKFELLSTTD